MQSPHLKRSFENEVPFFYGQEWVTEGRFSIFRATNV